MTTFDHNADCDEAIASVLTICSTHTMFTKCQIDNYNMLNVWSRCGNDKALTPKQILKMLS